MIYVTGDTHGDFFELHWKIRERGIGEGDVIIILGDVGFNYLLGVEDLEKKAVMNDIGCKFFCIQGNHEKRPDDLPAYHEDIYLGGRVYVEDEFPNLIFAQDGEVYDFNGKKAIVLGGAYSVDKFYRLAMGYRWFEDEQMSQENKDKAMRNLCANDWKVDWVLSHTCPYKYRPVEMFLSGLDQSTVDNSMEEWLDMVEHTLKYDAWYCGHWHTEKDIDKMHFRFHSLEAIWN